MINFSHDGEKKRPGTTRRDVLAGVAAVSVSVLRTRATRAAEAASPSPVKDWILKSDATPIEIPLDYLGLHSDHGVSRKAPPPTYPYDAIRSHDVDNGHDLPATQWADIEKNPGVFDWRLTDAWFATHPDKTRIWVLFGCPTFYQKYPNESFVFPHLPGGASPPKDPQLAANFVSELLKRYPGKIHYLEIWNEPNFGPGTDPLTDRWTAAIGEPGWFSGSASELAAMARAVRAVLPSDVKLMVSGWAWQAKEDQIGPANSVVRYAAAPDGDGGFGRDHVQAISVHLYTYNNDPNAAIEELRSYERIFDQCGYSKALPRFVTEAGAWYPGIYTTDWPSVEDKARNMKRWCMIPAAFGYRGVYLYKHSEVGPMGDPARVPEVSAAIAEMRNGLRGKTLTQAAVLEDDSIWLMFADGSELRA